MGVTIQLADTINWAKPFVRFMPLNIGTGNEPAISIGNSVRQTILGPPFCWRWNRSVAASFNTIVGIQDYTQTLSDFGFLEQVSLTNGSDSFAITNLKNILGKSSVQAKPTSAAAMSDPSTTSISFRLLPTPDKIYSVELFYQRAATLFTGLTQTWTPIPDHLSFVYNQGFLAFAAMYADDARWQIALQRFLASLIGVSEGLDEVQKNIFLETWLGSSSQSVASQLKAQIGGTSRPSLK